MNRREANNLLGLHSDNVSPDQIRQAYAVAVRREHPDHGGSGALLKKLKQARDLLTGGPHKGLLCRVCSGTGFVRQPGKLTRTSCPRGCEPD